MSFLKRWSTHRDKLCDCDDDDKDHLSLMKYCDDLKLGRHAKHNVNGLTNHALATPGLDFKLVLEHKNLDNTVIRVTNSTRETFF